MPKDDDKDPLTRWRRAERDYARAVKDFMTGEPLKLGKETQVDLARLRAKADRWRDRYFKRT